MKAQHKKKLPDWDDRPIFVQYVSIRRCRRNPSFDRFAELDPVLRRELMKRATERYNVRPLKDEKAKGNGKPA